MIKVKRNVWTISPVSVYILIHYHAFQSLAPSSAINTWNVLPLGSCCCCCGGCCCTRGCSHWWPGRWGLWWAGRPASGHDGSRLRWSWCPEDGTRWSLSAPGAVDRCSAAGGRRTRRPCWRRTSGGRCEDLSWTLARPTPERGWCCEAGTCTRGRERASNPRGRGLTSDCGRGGRSAGGGAGAPLSPGAWQCCYLSQLCDAGCRPCYHPGWASESWHGDPGSGDWWPATRGEDQLSMGHSMDTDDQWWWRVTGDQEGPGSHRTHNVHKSALSLQMRWEKPKTTTHYMDKWMNFRNVPVILLQVTGCTWACAW